MSSIVVGPTVDRLYGMPKRAAASATAGSPSRWNSREAPVGAIMTGQSSGRPNSVEWRSIESTPESCDGSSS
jgi:hypothetical protein